MAKDKVLFMLSLAFLGLIAAYMLGSSGSVETEAKDEADKDPSNVEVLMAKRSLAPGNRVSEDNTEWKGMPVGKVDATYVIKDDLMDEWLDDAVVTRRVPRGRPVKHDDLLLPGEKEESRKPIMVEPGKFSIPMALDDDDTLSLYIETGMVVDIVFTTTVDLEFGHLTLTLMKNLRVVGKQEDTGSESGAAKKTVVFLEMTTRQAELFSYAKKCGEITLALSDFRMPDLDNDELADMLHNCHSVNNFNSVLITYLVRQLFPGVPIDITKTKEGYIVSGTVKDAHIADKIRETLEIVAAGGAESVVNLMKVEPQQVMICVRVLEISSDYQSRLGVNWKALLENGGGAVCFGATFPRPGILDPNYFFEATGIKLGDWTLSEIVDFLQQNGNANTLAEPNLTTVSGETAEFFAGGEFPILIPQGGNLIGSVTVEYKKFGVILEFTPTVELNGLITLQVSPEVSAVDRRNAVILQGFVVPSLIARRADTTVRLWSGQTYAIAGLLQDETVRNDFGLWGLDRIPILGALFRSSEFRDRKSDLLILITPYLITTECQSDDAKETRSNGCIEEAAESGVFDFQTEPDDFVISTSSDCWKKPASRPSQNWERSSLPLTPNQGQSTWERAMPPRPQSGGNHLRSHSSRKGAFARGAL